MDIAAKLQIKPGTQVAVIGQPADGPDLAPLGPSVSDPAAADAVVAFARLRGDLTSIAGPAIEAAREDRLVAVAVWGAAFAGFAVVPGLWLTLILLAVAGAADTFTVVFRGTIVQVITPDEFRGRVMAADYIVGAGGGQLGNLEAGALGSLTSPVISALSGGLVTVAGVIAIGFALPAFTRYRRPQSDRAQDGLPTVAAAET